MISTSIPINKACILKAKGPAAETLAFKPELAENRKAHWTKTKKAREVKEKRNNRSEEPRKANESGHHATHVRR